MTTNFRINGDRLLRRLEQFATIGATAGGGVNRPALSETDRNARRLLAELAIERGFDVYQDAAANLFIRRAGQSDGAPFLIGSHLDSQPLGGKYDGALGVLAAFEVLETLEDQRSAATLPVEVVAWTNEEGSRFAPGAMGSRAFSQGAIPEAWFEALGSDGCRLADELEATLAALPEATNRPLGMPITGYLELHIEQGPTLEAENIPIGVVTGIQGARWLKVTVSGEAAHDGTTGLAYRKDALAAATAAMHQLYESVMPGDDDARLTIGRLSLHPGSVNTIPASVEFYVDTRHKSAEKIDHIEAFITRICDEQALRGGCTVTIEKILDMAPANFAPDLIETLTASAKNLGLQSKKLVSGAFHDALFIADVAPTGMIFVPCRNGRSHCEDEYVEPKAVIAGAELLFESTLNTIRQLDIGSALGSLRAYK